MATNTLGLGINVPDIRVVLHLEMPYRMAEYAQQSGRAGRDGQRSEAIVILLDAQGISRKPRPLISAHAATDDYIRGDVYRRVILDSVIDGRDDCTGCEEGEELCDVCQGQMPEVMSVEDREEADMQERELTVQGARVRALTVGAEEHRGFQDYRRKLIEQCLNGCMFCSVHGLDEGLGHSGLDCPKARAIGGAVTEAYQLAVKMERFMRRDRVAEAFGCCVGCFIPQELYNRWGENNEEGGWKRVSNGLCQYKGIMISTIAWEWTQLPEETMDLYDKLGLCGVSELAAKERREGIWRWMGRRVIWWNVEVLQMCLVFNGMIE
jgi:ferredoxin